jgi:hypothetical protein
MVKGTGISKPNSIEHSNPGCGSQASLEQNNLQPGRRVERRWDFVTDKDDDENIYTK